MFYNFLDCVNMLFMQSFCERGKRYELIAKDKIFERNSKQRRIK